MASPHCSDSTPIGTPAVRLVALLLSLACPVTATGQPAYDASWYDSAAPYVKIGVVADGVYRVEESVLQQAGVPPGVDPATLRLFENGREVPIQLEAGDVVFVGRRNRGTDEVWAYDGDAAAQSSPYYSLFSDTTFYWLTWGGANGLRYATASPPSGTSTSVVRDTLHREQDNRYFYGEESGDPRYTLGEGYYWARYSINNAGTNIERTYALDLDRLAAASSDDVTIRVRLVGTSGSQHRVRLDVEPEGGGPVLASDEVTWNRYAMATLSATFSAGAAPPDGQLQVRLTSYGDAAYGTPNYVSLDWIEAAYPRTLAAEGTTDAQHFTVPGGSYTFEVNNHTDPVRGFSPAEGNRYDAAAAGGGAFTFSATPSVPTTYWVVGANGYRTPAAVRADASSDWANPSNEADYVILTTAALRASAEALASYRQSRNGYAVATVGVQDVFDQFDYGRPTPVAIRRFVRATRDWATVPRFLTIWADAPYPVSKSNGVPQPRPAWAVPSFGYGPSDGWFAMQTGGPADWSEVLAVGRIPIRTNAAGDLFLEKLQTYEQAPLADWQKRMLMLAGGTSAGEQSTLQYYTEGWAETASAPTGMDTLYYFKNVNDPLDTSFQDSLRIDLRRGSGWLNYFGHSAAQTWEIVTDPPDEFDNAGRLPFVVSLACKTGSFAGGRFEDRDEPSLSEQLVVGTLNGSIAHWGTSELGNIAPSARLNTALVNRVFVDTARTMGLAIQDAKAEIATNFSASDVYVRHLLQYGLIGDPALELALPTRPDFHLAPHLITTNPTAPTPGDSLVVTTRLRNRGLVPGDSLTLEVTHEDPLGRATRESRRLAPFALEHTVQAGTFLDEASIGPNTFRFTADPENAHAEANEANNTVARRPVVFRTGVELIRPRDDGIVRNRRPTLRLHLIGGSAKEGTVIIELDSTASFDSPALQRARIAAANYVIDWKPRPLDDGTTYHWRARLEGTRGSHEWTTGRFTIRTDLVATGWFQQDAQLATNPEVLRLEYDGAWRFDTFPVEVFASSERGSGTYKGQFQVAAQTYERLNLGFGVLVVDDLTGAVLDHGSFCTYDVQDQYLNEGCTGALEQDAAIAALEALIDGVAPGDYVFTRTRHLGRAGGSSAIPEAVKTIFRTLGTSSGTYSAAIDTLTYDELWLMQARKGTPAATVETASGSTNEITRTTRLAIPHASGRIATARIGPARSWRNLAWTAVASGAGSEVTIDVFSGDGATVLDRFDALGATPRSLAGIDASTHPYLRLRATLADSTARRAPQLRQWRVTYTPTTEIAADAAALQAIPDTLDAGATASLAVPVRALSGPASGRVTVAYRLTDGANRTTTVARDTLGTLQPDEEATSTASFSTKDRAGPGRLTVQIDQNGPPEPVVYNNTLLRSFYVRPDRQPPDLKVLVEGRALPHDPDPVTNLQDPSLPFVSTKPTIEILVADDNRHFPLSDTSLTEVRLDGRLVPFSRPDLQFESGTEDHNEARIVFTPDLSGRDTTHTLRVDAEDPSGNMLAEPYQVHFRVQQEQVIRDLYPYPNPMNTHTTFAFRVEGGTQQPEDFRLRIYTLSGRLVRTFDGFDVNDGAGLRIGWNMLRWNGRDADGDRVATGVYLYRVVVKGEDGTFEGEVEKVAVIR